jgi:hypothetical protein
VVVGLEGRPPRQQAAALVEDTDLRCASRARDRDELEVVVAVEITDGDRGTTTE